MYADQTYQNDITMAFATENSLGSVELIIEDTVAGQQLVKLQSRMSAGDTL